MNKLAKVIRVLTISPIMALMLCLVLNFTISESFSSVLFLLITIFCLSIFPVLAYPVERKFHILNKLNGSLTIRAAERKLAIIFSCISYLVIFLLSLIVNEPIVIKQLTLTYLISGLLIFISSFIFKVEASGHMCGIVGPIVFLCAKVSLWFLLILVPLTFVIWSSLKLKRHTILELSLGSIIPIIGFIIALLVF